ncbi:MAG TPA: lipopolysaccharide biosynthesis protein [Vicinamibacterales bacterium]|nr:lipopolysaccharide biosynthesis protein [Vicinamibacterales bacterium]
MPTERPLTIDPVLDAGPTLTDQAAVGAQWMLTAGTVGAVLQMAFGIVLARMLTPESFGLVALAFVVLGAARPLCDLSIGNAVVQRADLTPRHIRVAFTCSLLLGITGAALIAAFAPLAAALMRDAEVAPVLRVLAIEFAIAGTTIVAGALLRRRMDFRRIAWIETGTSAIGYGVVAVILAVLGYGVWSLVYGALTHSVLASVWFFSVSPHPCRPLLAARELRDLLRFGIGASVSGLVHHAAMTVDNFVVGRWLGASAVGTYSRAYHLVNTPNRFSIVWTAGVLFPALAQAQSDAARLGRAYLSVTQLTAMLAAPGMVALAIAAPHLLRSVYGPQWVDAAIPLQILCLAGYLRALYQLGAVVAQSVGRVYAELWRQTAYAGLVVVGAVAGTRYGLPGVAAGVDAAIIFMFVALGQLALRVTGLSWLAYLRVQMPPLITAAAVCAIAMPVRLLLEAMRLPSGAITFGVLAAAAIPWAVGGLWQLGEPRFERLRSRLPAPVAAMAFAFRRCIAAPQE